MTSIRDIHHYYVCLGCNSKHPTHRSAIVCCAVVQEIWECSHCWLPHPNLRLAIRCVAVHLRGERNVEETGTI